MEKIRLGMTCNYIFIRMVSKFEAVQKDFSHDVGMLSGSFSSTNLVVYDWAQTRNISASIDRFSNKKN
jgi:hypothetical protein